MYGAQNNQTVFLIQIMEQYIAVNVLGARFLPQTIGL